MITREQVADLQPGDVVEFRDNHYPDVVTRGPLREEDGGLILGNVRFVRWDDGSVPRSGEDATLTVVSRAPRSLYVNHPRTEPVAGDVVRDADDETSKRTWCHDNDGRFCWWGIEGGEATFNSRAELPTRLRLLVDGETGQVVP